MPPEGSVEMRALITTGTTACIRKKPVAVKGQVSNFESYMDKLKYKSMFTHHEP